MSTQSISLSFKQSLHSDNEKNLERYALNYRYEKDYAIKQKIDKEDIFHKCKINEILCSNNSDLLLHVEKVIEGGRKKYTPKSVFELEKETSSDLYKIWLSRGNIGTIYDFLDLITSGDIVETGLWKETQW